MPRADAPNLKAVIVPSEHGASVMLAESIIAGLLIASSPKGLIAAFGWAFTLFMVQPLKIAAKDISRGIFTTRTKTAVYYGGLFAALTFATLAVGFLWSGKSLISVLAVVVALGLVHLWATMTVGKKELLAELFGALSLGAAAASILVVAGAPLAKAFYLWLVLAIRAGTSVFYVRARLRFARQENVRVPELVAVHLLAYAVLTLLVACERVNHLLVWAGLLLFARLLFFLGPRKTTAQTVGIQEGFLGILYVLFVVWAFQAPVSFNH